MIFAIGDIHGAIDELLIVHRKIMADYAGANEDHTIVFLGDYIDRGENSKEVVEYLLKMPFTNFKHVFLKGNHEAMASDAFKYNTSDFKSFWLDNGGNTTLYDYGMERSDIKKGAMPTSLQELYNKLRPYYIHKNLLFVHAGINPYEPFMNQNENTWLWIRKKFLTAKIPFDNGFAGKTMRVIHGHTPVMFDPEQVDIDMDALILHNRINLDTSAVYTKKLSCAVFNNDGIFQEIISSSFLDKD